MLLSSIFKGKRTWKVGKKDRKTVFHGNLSKKLLNFIIPDETLIIDNSPPGRMTNSLNGVKREEREAQVSLGNRNQKIAEWKNAYVGVASILAGFYQLADRVDLADRIRPTTRKVTGTAREETGKTEKEETKVPEIIN